MTDHDNHHPTRLRRTTAGVITAIFVLVTLVVVALIAETYLESRSFNGYCAWPQNMRRKLSPLPGIMPGVYGDSWFRTNRYGIRGRDISKTDEYLILTIGGSTTECLFLDDSESWPRLLEDRLNGESTSEKVWVGSVGKSGLNTRHHIVQAEILFEQMPEIDVLVMMVGINDLSLKLSRDKFWRPTMPGSERTQEFREEAFFVYPDSTRTAYRFPELRNRFKIFWAKIFGASVNVAPAMVQDAKGEAYVNWRAGRRKSKLRRERAPDLKEALREYRRNIDEIISIAKERGVRVVFATQPSLWKREMPAHEERLLWMGGVGRFQQRDARPYYTSDVLELCIAKYNRALVRTCRNSGVDCVDLAAIIPKDTTAFYDDCHFNEAGARIVASAIADYLLSNPPSKDR